MNGLPFRDAVGGYAVLLESITTGTEFLEEKLRATEKIAADYALAVDPRAIEEEIMLAITQRVAQAERLMTRLTETADGRALAEKMDGMALTMLAQSTCMPPEEEIRAEIEYNIADAWKKARKSYDVLLAGATIRFMTPPVQNATVEASLKDPSNRPYALALAARAREINRERYENEDAVQASADARLEMMDIMREDGLSNLEIVRVMERSTGIMNRATGADYIIANDLKLG